MTRLHPVGIVVADVGARLQAVTKTLDNASELREVKHLEPAVVGALHDAYPDRTLRRTASTPSRPGRRSATSTCPGT